jgi:hypothetical protein
MSKLGSTLGTAIASNDFATTKQTLAAFFATTGQGLAQVETTMTDAPANVQAALTVVNQYFSQLQSVIASSTSMKQLETSMASQANNAQIKAAGQTLDAYTKSQCGDVTSSSP